MIRRSISGLLEGELSPESDFTGAPRSRGDSLRTDTEPYLPVPRWSTVPGPGQVLKTPWN